MRFLIILLLSLSVELYAITIDLLLTSQLSLSLLRTDWRNPAPQGITLQTGKPGEVPANEERLRINV